MTNKDTGYRLFDLNGLYPTPKERIQNPTQTPFEQGDLVKVLVGPATGKNGVIAIDRNANFTDSEPYASGESIGVVVFEKTQLHSTLEEYVLNATGDPEQFFNRTLRWFDTPNDLELLQRQTKE